MPIIPFTIQFCPNYCYLNLSSIENIVLELKGDRVISKPKFYLHLVVYGSHEKL